jgi:hypothetical protein
MQNMLRDVFFLVLRPASIPPHRIDTWNGHQLREEFCQFIHRLVPLFPIISGTALFFPRPSDDLFVRGQLFDGDATNLFEALNVLLLLHVVKEIIMDSLN